MNCSSCYRALTFLEHGMKIVEIVLEKRHCRLATVNEIQVGFMSDKGAVDEVFILRLQEKCCAKGK